MQAKLSIVPLDQLCLFIGKKVTPRSRSSAGSPILLDCASRIVTSDLRCRSASSLLTLSCPSHGWGLGGLQ